MEQAFVKSLDENLECISESNSIDTSLMKGGSIAELV